MMNVNVFVELYPDMGRGLETFASLKKGTFVMQSELLVLDVADTMIVNSTELKHYTFKYSDFQDCLCLGLGEIFNHSDTPNVKYELEDFEQQGQKRKVMMFTALRDIEAGEQLFIDYNADTKVNIEEYKNSESMMK